MALTGYEYRAGYEYDRYEVGLRCVLEPEVGTVTMEVCVSYICG